MSSSTPPTTLIGTVPNSKTVPSLDIINIGVGTWFWKVCAFNGQNETCSTSIWEFSVCHPNVLGTPVLSPLSGTMLVSEIDLSWTVQCSFFFF